VDSEQQFTTLPVLPIDGLAAKQFEQLVRNRKLKKIGRGDLLIASIALAQKATLATRNLRDFEQVPGLKAENWAD
jgi:tRNA(fMet)-specific endonuclease VapC